jgi:hypothetical protein
VIVYVVLRGGLLPGQPATQEANPYGFAAIAVLLTIA